MGVGVVGVVDFGVVGGSVGVDGLHGLLLVCLCLFTLFVFVWVGERLVCLLVRWFVRLLGCFFVCLLTWVFVW